MSDEWLYMLFSYVLCQSTELRTPVLSAMREETEAAFAATDKLAHTDISVFQLLGILHADLTLQAFANSGHLRGKLRKF